MLRVMMATLAALALAACGSSSDGSVVRDAGQSCVAIGQDAFCSSSIPCCGTAWCDPSTARCRDPNACGVSGGGCDDAHACCSGLVCRVGQCASPQTSSGNGSTSGGCLPLGTGCLDSTECCSGACALGDCVQPTSGGGTTSSNGGGTTTGGTCSSAGAGCASGTECCSGRCNSGVCG